MSKQQVQAMQQSLFHFDQEYKHVRYSNLQPNLITVKYESGKLKAWSQTHLLKYYMLDKTK